MFPLFPFSQKDNVLFDKSKENVSLLIILSSSDSAVNPVSAQKHFLSYSLIAAKMNNYHMLEENFCVSE